METKLHYAGNVFVKEISLDTGESFPSHRHKWDHLSHVAHGIVEIIVDGLVTTLTAPATVLIRAHKDHAIRAVLGPARWLCIHAIRDEGGELLPDDAIAYTDNATLPTPLTYNEFSVD